MPKVTTRRKRLKLPFLTVHVPVGWEVKPLTPAEKKARKKKREDEAKKAQQEVERHAKAQAKKPAEEPAAKPAPPGQWPYGAAVMPPPGRTAPTRKATRSGNLCGQPTKQGGTCKRVVANVPCPDHPAGKPKGRP